MTASARAAETSGEMDQAPVTECGTFKQVDSLLFSQKEQWEGKICVSAKKIAPQLILRTNSRPRIFIVRKRRRSPIMTHYDKRRLTESKPLRADGINIGVQPGRQKRREDGAEYTDGR